MPAEPISPAPRSYLEIFGALIRDHRVSHGAFRLWHALRDYTDHESRCFPGQRRLANDLGCNIHSLKGWTGELVTSGWLRIDEVERGFSFTYTILNGEGQVLRKSATPTVAESGNSSVAKNSNGGVAENGNGLLLKVATKVRSPFKSVQVSERAGPQHSPGGEIPSWEEFWAYCQTQACLLPAEWYARDKFLAADASNWKGKENWQAYARRCKGWWEADGKPMKPTNPHANNRNQPPDRNEVTFNANQDIEAIKRKMR